MDSQLTETAKNFLHGSAEKPALYQPQTLSKGAQTPVKGPQFFERTKEKMERKKEMQKRRTVSFGRNAPNFREARRGGYRGVGVVKDPYNIQYYTPYRDR